MNKPYIIKYTKFVYSQAHLRNYWKKAGDPTRCDADAVANSANSSSAAGNSANSASVPLVRQSASVPLGPVITEPAVVPSLVPVGPIRPRDLASRDELDYQQAFEARSSYKIDTNYTGDVRGFRDLCTVQANWDR